MKNVKQDIPDGGAGSSAQIVANQKTEEGGTTQIFEVNANFAGPIQSAFMFLTNLTILEAG